MIINSYYLKIIKLIIVSSILVSFSCYAEKFECVIETSSIVEEKSSLFGSGGFTFKVNGSESNKIYYFFEEKDPYFSVDGERYPLIKLGNNYFLEKTPAGNFNFVKELKTSKGKFVTVSKSFDFLGSVMFSNILLKCI